MNQLGTQTLAIVLAAGLGTRMRSEIPKVMHPLGGEPLIRHVMRTAIATSDGRAVVVGPDMLGLEAEIRALDAGASLHTQEKRLGTGHAVMMAAEAIAGPFCCVLVMFGDTPLMRPETLLAVRERLDAGADVCVLGFECPEPAGYGRLLMDGDRLVAIREDAAASNTEKTVTFCNSGVMGFRRVHLPALLEAIGTNNPKGEYFLTDAVEIADGMGLSVTAIAGEMDEFLGINSRAQLAEAEAVFQDRRRRDVLDAGATLVAPETVFFSADSRVGRDVLIEPNVIFGPDVVVEDGARILAFSHLEGAHIGSGATVGPFARIRPGTRTGQGAKIGNFVETKKAEIGDGAKVNHLSYIGDATIGAKANIGAGTITCNYDGFNKYETVIGEGAFIGSNSALIAPAEIGAGAYVGSGSVITDSVPDNALAVARGRQTVKPNWAADFRKKSAK